MLKKPCIIMASLSLMLSVLVGCHSTMYPDNNNINSDGSTNSKQLSADTIEVYKTNGFYYVYIDNETGVLYWSNSKGLTPMYNADGTLKTARQEE